MNLPPNEQRIQITLYVLTLLFALLCYGFAAVFGVKGEYTGATFFLLVAWHCTWIVRN